MIVKGPIRRFNTIGVKEREWAMDAMDAPLSAFLGGDPEGGRYVQELENKWCETFGCTHAIAVNSATSGLLAACHAVGIWHHESWEGLPSDRVIVSPYTMSATAAAPLFLGADLEFVDVEPNHYCLSVTEVGRVLDRPFERPTTIIATNLFGHPAQLDTLKKLAHAKGAYLIEDNAQAPFAMENGSYAGTIGDIGVFSLNVHKHIQSGEGGVVVTDNDEFAHAVRLFINHGEMAGAALGLNLRMTEVTAAIACAQLSRGKKIVQSRIDLAEKLIEGLKDNPLVTIHPPRKGCKNVYYALPMEVNSLATRQVVFQRLTDEGVPICEGYVAPLYWMPAFREFAPNGGCPVTEKLHTESLVYFEVCGHDPTDEQIKQIIDAFAKVNDSAQKSFTVQTDQAPERWYGISPTVADRGWGRR